MLYRTTLLPSPRDYLAEGEAWPRGRLVEGVPPEVLLLAGVSARLEQARAGITVRELAWRSETAPQTILNLLSGKSWGDVVTMAKLERALDVALLVWGASKVAT